MRRGRLQPSLLRRPNIRFQAGSQSPTPVVSRVGLAVGTIEGVHAAPARSLHVSSVPWASTVCRSGAATEWFILVGKQRPVTPDTVTEPYDLTLTTAQPIRERRSWSSNVLAALQRARRSRRLHLRDPRRRPSHRYPSWRGWRAVGAVVEAHGAPTKGSSWRSTQALRCCVGIDVDGANHRRPRRTVARPAEPTTGP